MRGGFPSRVRDELPISVPLHHPVVHARERYIGLDSAIYQARGDVHRHGEIAAGRRRLRPLAHLLATYPFANELGTRDHFATPRLAAAPLEGGLGDLHVACLALDGPLDVTGHRALTRESQRVLLQRSRGKRLGPGFSDRGKDVLSYFGGENGAQLGGRIVRFLCGSSRREKQRGRDKKQSHAGLRFLSHFACTYKTVEGVAAVTVFQVNRIKTGVNSVFTRFRHNRIGPGKTRYDSPP